MADGLGNTSKAGVGKEVEKEGGITKTRDKEDDDEVISLPDDDDEKTGIVHLMKEAYCIPPHREDFCCPNGWKQQRLKLCTNMYHCAPVKHCFLELDLEIFSKWYAKLPFSKLMDYHKRLDCDEVWEYSVILLNPKMVVSCPDQSKKKRYEWAKHAISAFYKNTFKNCEEDAAVVDASLDVDSSIIVAGRRKKEDRSREDRSDTVLIAALTYRAGTEDECGKALVCWFLVAGVQYPRPRVIPQWRCLGFGRFMLIMLIKRCTLSLLPVKELAFTDDPLDGVEIYLQCTEEAAFKYYISCGFVHLNNDEESGLELVPKTISATFASEGEESKVWSARQIPPWIMPESEEVKMVPLLRLDPGCLKQSSAAMLGSHEVGNSVWCRYPPSRLVGSDSEEVPTEDLEKAFEGLNLLQHLLPTNKLAGAASPASATTLSSALSGEISWAGRLAHGRAGGEGWMTFGELQMMLALITRDGRYDQHVHIIPLRTMQHIEEAAMAFIKSVISGNKKLSTAGALYEEYQALMNYVVKDYIFFNRNLLEKKIIVFPCNIKNVHWAVTFVFNPAHIEASTAAKQRGSPQPCFFRYCSKHPDGSRRIHMKKGITWFLNLVYSYEQHMKHNHGGVMKWSPVFGDQTTGLLTGTVNFPAVKILQNGVLPKQVDDFSCGIGMVAGVAIILDTFIGKAASGVEILFDTKLSEVVVDNAESVLLVPEGILEPLPKNPTSPSSDYLHDSKNQWFILFDRIAHLQHVILPRRNNPDAVIKDELLYLSLKAKIEALPWPGTKDFLTADAPRKLDENGDTDPPDDDDSPFTDARLEKDQEMKYAMARLEKDEGSDDDGDKKVRAVLPAKKTWKENGKPDGDSLNYWVDVDTEEKYDKNQLLNEGRYKSTLSERSVERFATQWRGAENDSERVLTDLDRSLMNRFVEDSFKKWNWNSNKQFEAKMTFLKKKRDSEMQKYKSKKKRYEIYEEQTKLIEACKKERRWFRLNLEREWKMGQPALLYGLKYNPAKDIFTGRFQFRDKNSQGNMVDVTEDLVVSEEWILEAGFKPGVVQHVVNLGSSDEGFLPIPGGRNVVFHRKKVTSLRWVPPSVRWQNAGNGTRGKEIRNGKTVAKKARLEQVPVPAYWEVKLHGEKNAMRVDDAFVRQFKQSFLDELKGLQCGFVDIPVGDFKASHLQQHPSLQIQNAPKVHFVQSDGDDLCVSKSLASALYALNSFNEEATRLNEYGEKHLKGGTVDAIKKVALYAQGLLPRWIERKGLKKPEEFQWEVLLQEDMKSTIALCVLNESDGNSSHAVTIHGGYVYDANEVIAIPLCKEALDYCCSTETTKNTFVSFRRVTTFRYHGTDKHKVQRMTLEVKEDSPKKRKREEVTDGTSTGGSKPKYIFL